MPSVWPRKPKLYANQVLSYKYIEVRKPGVSSTKEVEILRLAELSNSRPNPCACKTALSFFRAPQQIGISTDGPQNIDYYSPLRESP